MDGPNAIKNIMLEGCAEIKKLGGHRFHIADPLNRHNLQVHYLINTTVFDIAPLKLLPIK